MPLEKVSVEDALALVVKPTTRGRSSEGKKLVDEFLESKEAFARAKFTTEKDRASKMQGIRKAITDAGLADKVWVRPDGASVIFINFDLVNELPADEAKAISDAYDSYKATYANVGRKTDAKKK